MIHESEVFDHYISPKELSDLMRVSVESIYKDLKKGRLKSIKIGRQWRVSMIEINKLINGDFFE